MHYDDDICSLEEAVPDLKEDLQLLNAALERFFQNDFNHEEFNEAFPAFAKCISRIKNYGFREENEIRIAAFPSIHTPELIQKHMEVNEEIGIEKPIQYYLRNGLQVPYINLFSGIQYPLPITKIIVGPHKDQDIRRKSLAMRLRDTNIDVVASRIPFI